MQRANPLLVCSGANPQLTPADRVVLATLESAEPCDDQKVLDELRASTDPSHLHYLPSVVTTFDIYKPQSRSIQYCIKALQSMVRHPSDAVFANHILFYVSTLLPSAWILWHSYTPWHAFLHWMLALYCAGPFTLMLHNHLHGTGLFKRRFGLIDKVYPYVLGPLLGHTADSYRFHHRYMHHVEGNGPDDLSSTLRYQRDSLFDFLLYFGDFLLCTWFKLPLYLWRYGRRAMAIRAFSQEMLSFAFIAWAVYQRPRPALVLFVVPLLEMRFGMMLGNFGQHAFIDPDEPDSDMRSSITLVDATSNRYSFNDGYHTSHHLNPLRHWRDHPHAMLSSKEQYAEGGALVFKDIDFLFISIRLFRKDYRHLARCLVPIGDQRELSLDERITMLQSRTRRFTEEEIGTKFKRRTQWKRKGT